MVTWSDHCTEIVDTVSIPIGGFIICKIQRQIMTGIGSIYLIVLNLLFDFYSLNNITVYNFDNFDATECGE